ncbi:E3 ubiquitin-protein ligase rnf168 [Hoplias malabaricus]|uniref:E3 ubiquitin-protein ligase rnf168 n=1 Tax=Hoplias malabaricus TaxID=27720 RepID=UPI003462F743
MPPVSETEPELMKEGSGKLTRADCLCPVCLEIYLEPVTLPCTHTFCKPCFLETVDKANICCPLCRKRVSSWARLNGRNKTLVNVELWKRIQDAFPAQCQRRLNGIDDEEDMYTLIPKPKVSQPGELRREYEDQVSKLVEEKRALEEAERRASEEYIQRLLAEEEERIAEERRMEEKKQLEEDERLARMLSLEINSSPVVESQTNVKPNDATSVKKKKSCVGHIEKFLCPVPCRNPSAETIPTARLLDNKENILNTQTTFWPCSVEHTSLEMPVLDYCNKPSTSDSDLDCSKHPYGISGRTNTSKRKTMDNELDDSDLSKRPCGSVLPSSPKREGLLQELAQQEEALWSRSQQEEEDRLLALKLQKELDREISVDRRKGSVDEYLLRQKSNRSSTSTIPGEDIQRGKSSDSVRSKADGAKGAKRVSRTISQPVGQFSKTSSVSTLGSNSSASLVQRSSKQTTLTEMFPGTGS